MTCRSAEPAEQRLISLGSYNFTNLIANTAIFPTVKSRRLSVECRSIVGGLRFTGADDQIFWPGGCPKLATVTRVLNLHGNIAKLKRPPSVSRFSNSALKDLAGSVTRISWAILA